MRTAGEIHHPECKITILNWNQKFLLKFERGPLEQIYKVAELDIGGPDDVKRVLTEAFIATVVARFHAMEADFTQALEA